MNDVARNYREMGTLATYQAMTLVQPDSLRVVVVERLDDLVAHARAWNELCAASPDPVPRYSYAFLQPYLSLEVKPPNRWICLFAYRGRTLAGVMPLIVSTRQARAALNGPWNGSGRPSLRGWTILAARGSEREVTDAFLSELAQLTPDYFCIRFPFVHPRASVVQLRDNFKLVRTYREDCGRGAVLPLEGDFESYLKGLDRTFKQNLRRWEKKLMALAPVRVDFVSGSEVQDCHFEDFIRLEASGWKGRLGTAIGCNPRQAAFYRAWFQQLREAGWAELQFLKSGDRLIAAHFAVRVGDVLTAWKIAHDEEYRSLAPGNLLVLKLIEHLYQGSGVREIDAVSNTDWHRQWRMSTRPYYNIYWYPRRTYNFLFGEMPLHARDFLMKVPVIRSLANAMRNHTDKVSAALSAATPRVDANSRVAPTRK